MSDYLIPVIVAIFASAPGLYAVWQGRKFQNASTRREDASTSEVYERIARGTGEQMEGLRIRIDALEAQVDMYERTLTEWRDGIEKLLCQMAENDIAPIWTPPPDSHEIPSRPRKRKP